MSVGVLSSSCWWHGPSRRRELSGNEGDAGRCLIRRRRTTAEVVTSSDRTRQRVPLRWRTGGGQGGSGGGAGAGLDGGFVRAELVLAGFLGDKARPPGALSRALAHHDCYAAQQ